MQCIQGHILSSMIPRHGEEGLSLCGSDPGRSTGTGDRTSSTCFFSPAFAMGALSQLCPACDREEARVAYQVYGVWGVRGHREVMFGGEFLEVWTYNMCSSRGMEQIMFQRERGRKNAQGTLSSVHSFIYQLLLWVHYVVGSKIKCWE